MRQAMSNAAREMWLWQQIVSPHMAGLASALAARGWCVTYVANTRMSAERARLGWQCPDLGGARLMIGSSASDVTTLARSAPRSAVHLCEGIRGNGLVGTAQRALMSNDARVWVAMETIDLAGIRGLLKALEYRRLMLRMRSKIEGVLAIGHRTAAWVESCGMLAQRVFPFAYFLQDRGRVPYQVHCRRDGFRVAFVGRIDANKRLSLLISALATIRRPDIELIVVGAGPLEPNMRALARRSLDGPVTWTGILPMGQVQALLATVDCLVLPSRHDGWGVVVSEALMVGTPVICSDGCGSAGVVRASCRGGVFESGSAAQLAEALSATLEDGHYCGALRQQLAEWAEALGADAGATYLERIIEHATGHSERPRPPWTKSAHDA
ncbi:MAG: glycosyltransferase [Gammaproteobacteria bacterium]|nr:MAG: glycosyltransferase [Gammaproteobacteria bacterium]